MSKTASPALFELIHNMSKSEKRYFKIRSSRHTIGDQNKYVQIFDFIDQQEVFDEDALFDHFEGESFLNKFSITKNRLYDQIMKALDSYHSNASIDATIYRHLHGAEILYNKSLYDHAIKQLRSAERLAKKHQKIELQLKVDEFMNRIYETQGYKSISLLELDKRSENHEELLETQSFYSKLWTLKSKLFLLMNQSGTSRSNEELKNYKNIWNQYEAIKAPDNLSFRELYLKNHFESAFYYASLNKEKSLECLHKNLKLMQSDKKYIQQTPQKYLSLLTNTIHLELSVGDRKKIFALLGELNTFQKKYKIDSSEDLSVKMFSSIKSTNLMVHIHQAEFEKAVLLEEDVIKGLETFGNAITPVRRAYLSFKLAIAFFGMEEFNKCLKWINAILNDNELDEKEDIVAFAHIVGLITHFELNNESYLPYALKSTLRFLDKRKRSYSFETLFLKNLRKIIRTDDPFKVEQLLKQVANDIDELAKDPFESVAFEYFDFKSWLIAKVKHKKFQTVKRSAFLAASA